MAAALGNLCLVGTPSVTSRRGLCCPVAAPPAAASKHRHRRAARLLVAADQGFSEADLYQTVAPPGQQPALQPAAQPWYITGPLALAGLIAALRVAKTVKKQLSGSNRLEERGFKRGAVADDRAYTKAIQGMRKVQYEELSEEQILAARKRRQKEVQRDMAPMDLESIELPENHPFAVRKALAPEEEALQRSRLSARRGLSEEDMRRLREQQALADQMDAQEEARQQAMRQQGRF